MLNPARCYAYENDAEDSEFSEAGAREAVGEAEGCSQNNQASRRMRGYVDNEDREQAPSGHITIS